MKILFLANDSGGLFNFRKEMVETLLQHNNVVYLCFPFLEHVDDFRKMGCMLIECTALDRRSTNPLKDLSLLRFYRRILVDIKPDIVLSYTIKPNVYGGIACQQKKVPYISNVTGLGTTIENGGLISQVSIQLYKLGLRKANCVFFQNKDNEALFIKSKIVKTHTRVIPGSGVNLGNHSYEPYPSSDGNRFLFVGRIMKDKGIEELLEAASILHQENQAIMIDVVGYSDEDYTKELSKAERSGAIVFHGLQSNVHDFYKRCHCCVLPSYHEGTANVMLEASATGRPVITTRVPGCKETFDEEITGFGCEAKSTSSLLQAMRRFIALPYEKRAQMGRAARAKMEREYDRQIVVNAYLEEIQQATARKETK